MKQEIKFEYLKLDDLTPYERNTRNHDRRSIDSIKSSIRETGMNDPIGVWGDKNIIVEGHGRYLACKELGIETVPVLHLDYLTDEERRKYAIAHNRTTELSEFNEYLKLELEELNFECPDLHFDEIIIENDNNIENNIVEDEAPEVDNENEPITKQGDIWQLGNHRLMCGDSTDKATVEKLMNGVKADLVFTDPPYGMSAVSKSGVLSKTYKTDIMNDNNNDVAIKSFKLSQTMFADAKQVWWGANYYTECLPSSECWLVWDKNNGGSDQTDCELAWANFRSVVRQFTLASEKINRVHPTQKPVKLIQLIFNKFDKENKFINVVDLFGGSGSTLIACEQLNRQCYMMELDPKYCDVIIKRWETLTGKKAKLVKEN